VAYGHVQFNGDRDASLANIFVGVHMCREEGFRGRVKVNGCVTTKSAILISAQFNISPHYSFMVQNQIAVSLCPTTAI